MQKNRRGKELWLKPESKTKPSYDSAQMLYLPVEEKDAEKVPGLKQQQDKFMKEKSSRAIEHKRTTTCIKILPLESVGG